MALFDPWSELRVGADFLSLTSGSPFIAIVFPPSPRRLLRDLAAGSNMSESSEEIPMSGEDYQLFPRRLFPGDNPEPTVMSSPSPSLLVGYRSLGQIITVAASMGVSSPSTRPVVPSLGMSPQTPVTSVPVRPTVCVVASAPAVTAPSARVVPPPEDVYIVTAMPENISPEEYQLSLQQSNPEVGKTSQDPNCLYFSHYA